MTVTVGIAPGAVVVRQCNGQTIEVLTQDERVFFERQRDAYIRDFAFTHATDIADLDRLLVLEVQAFRQSRHLTSGRDHLGDEISDSALAAIQRQQKVVNAQIAEVKNSLGMSKEARDSASVDSVSAYIESLRRRAKAFGQMREKQLSEAICIMQEIRSLIGTFRRANQTERERLGMLNEEELIQHIETHLIPRFEAVDLHFRTHQQRLWVGTI